MSLVEKQLASGRNEIDWHLLVRSFSSRSAKQARERWQGSLDPSLHRGPWTPQEIAKVEELVGIYGTQWNLIEKVCCPSGY